MVFIVRKINSFESCGQIYVGASTKPKQKKSEKNYDLIINVNSNRSTRGRSKTETTTENELTSENTLTFSSMSLNRRRRHEKGLDKHVFQNIPYPFPNSQERKQSKSGFISSFLKGSRSKSNNGEAEIMSIKQDNHFQSMIGVLAQLRAVCKVTMEISSELTVEINRIGHKIVSINHRLEAAKRKTQFHTLKNKCVASNSRIQDLANKIHTQTKQNNLERYPENPIGFTKTVIGIPEALKHRYDKRCHKDPQFHSSSDSQLMTITSVIFKDYKEIPTNGPFCSFMHDVEVLNWVKEGHMTRCAELYSFPKLFQLKWNEKCAASIRSTSSIDETLDEGENISDVPHKERPAQILLERKGKSVPHFVTSYLNGEVEDNHLSTNLSHDSFQFFKELSFNNSSSTRTSNSSCSTNGTIIFNSQKYCSLAELIESEIHRHVDHSLEWQTENEKKKPRNKRDSLLYINEEYYAKKRCREKLKESINNYKKNKRLMEELKILESDDDECSFSSDTGSVIRISKSSFSATERPRPSSIDTIASAINIEFNDSPPNATKKDPRLSTAPYCNYLKNSKHGNKKSSDDTSDDSEYSDDEAHTDTLSNLPSIFNVIEESKKNMKFSIPPPILSNDLNILSGHTTQPSFENTRRRAVIDMDGEELTILHTLRTEEPLRFTEEDDQDVGLNEVAFSFGPITTLTQEVISIDKISERVQKSRPLIQSHLHNTNSTRNEISKRNIDNNHPVLGKMIQQPKIVHPHFNAHSEDKSEDEYSSTEDEDTDTISDFPRCERIIQPSSFISDATLLETSNIESTTPEKSVPITRKVVKEIHFNNIPPPKIVEPNKSLFKEEIANFRTFRPSTSSYSSSFSSFDEGGFLDSVVPITQVSTNSSKPRAHNIKPIPKANHLSPSIDFDLPSSYEYSLKIMELEQKKHVQNSQFYSNHDSSIGDENYSYSDDDEYDDGMYHIPESHQSRYIPSDSSFSDMDSF